MKVSEFVGKTVKEIVRESSVNGSNYTGWLIIFNDDSKMLAHDEENIFYTEKGENTEMDIPEIPYSNFWHKLS